MSEWVRQTRETTLANIAPELSTVIQHHIDQNNLGPILSDTLFCIQTDSEKAKKGLFGKAESVQLAAIVTPRWLVWAMQGTKSPTVVLSAQLSQVTVRDYAQTQFVKMIPDSGIEVTGMFTDSKESVSAFIGLDDGPAAKKFKDITIRAAQDAKK